MVEKKVAEVLSNGVSLPLECISPAEGVTFYVEGGPVMHPERSDWCAAWDVPLRPEAKPKARGKAKRQKEETAPVHVPITHTVSEEEVKVCVPSLGGKEDVEYTYKVPVLVCDGRDIETGDLLQPGTACYRAAVPWDSRAKPNRFGGALAVTKSPSKSNFAQR